MGFRIDLTQGGPTISKISMKRASGGPKELIRCRSRLAENMETQSDRMVVGTL